MHHASWHKIKLEKKAGVMGTLRTHFDLTPHMQSKLWPKIQKVIEHHLAKVYTDNKSSLKKEYWVLKPDGTRDKASNHDLPQTSSSQIWISILTIGLILRTLPEPFKILKIRQRARSFAGRDLDHLLSSEICRWRALRLERGDVEAQGSRRQYADGCALHQGLDNGHGSKEQATGAHSRCPSCLRSFSRNMRSVVAAGGRGEDDEPGTDEDVGKDEDVDGDEKS
ncbi:hypothetical protein Tco_0729252 [Tanacetum coccineum]|uniref:Uncharacterized protein n=1 Tax=Tanacetum coccineum TaxID=301880 RepID=A0ABQ4YPI3_9ASTR